jgi:hypothetical protein
MRVRKHLNFILLKFLATLQPLVLESCAFLGSAVPGVRKRLNFIVLLLLVTLRPLVLKSQVSLGSAVIGVRSLMCVP